MVEPIQPNPQQADKRGINAYTSVKKTLSRGINSKVEIVERKCDKVLFALKKIYYSQPYPNKAAELK